MRRRVKIKGRLLRYVGILSGFQALALIEFCLDLEAAWERA